MPFSSARKDFKLKWTESTSAIDFNSFVPGEQLVNHLQNNKVSSQFLIPKELQEWRSLICTDLVGVHASCVI